MPRRRRRTSRRRRSVGVPKLGTVVAGQNYLINPQTTDLFGDFRINLIHKAGEWDQVKLMGIKHTAIGFQADTSPSTVGNAAMFGVGLLKATTTEALTWGSTWAFTSVHLNAEQTFRRVFARESFISYQQREGGQGATTPGITPMVQRRVKGTINLVNGQALYAVAWGTRLFGSQTTFGVAGMIEYSYTARVYNSEASATRMAALEARLDALQPQGLLSVPESEQ